MLQNKLHVIFVVLPSTYAFTLPNKYCSVSLPLLRRFARKFWQKPLPKNAKCPLPFGVRRSKGKKCERDFSYVCVDNLFVNISYKRTAVMFGLSDWK